MTEPRKLRYEITLSDRESTDTAHRVSTRPLEPSDRDELARLILDAYLGTIDYEGETIVEAGEAIDDWLDGGPLLLHSHAALVDDTIISATLTTIFEDAPFIAIVMTHPTFKAQGYGTAVVTATLDSLREDGHDNVALYITEGNEASEALFRKLGAVEIPEP